jgi:hypothetical protein
VGLATQGYTAIEATNGKAAIELLQDPPPDPLRQVWGQAYLRTDTTHPRRKVRQAGLSGLFGVKIDDIGKEHAGSSRLRAGELFALQQD